MVAGAGMGEANGLYEPNGKFNGRVNYRNRITGYRVSYFG